MSERIVIAPNDVTTSPWLDRALRGICALCERPALYISRDGSAGRQGGMDILEPDPHPTGKWVPLAGGRYRRLPQPPPDGRGHRAHSCRRKAAA